MTERDEYAERAARAVYQKYGGALIWDSRVLEMAKIIAEDYAPLRAELARVTGERDRLAERAERGERALSFIEVQGYRRCDIPACNCGSWHGGHLSARFDEIEVLLEDAMETNGKTLLACVREIIEERDRLRAALDYYAEEGRWFPMTENGKLIDYRWDGRDLHEPWKVAREANNQ